MTHLTRSDVEQAIADYQDPYLEQDLITAKCITDIEIEADRVVVKVVLRFPAESYQDALARELRKRIKALGVENVDVSVSWDIQSHAVQPGVKTLENVKNIIAVASGKGGVGKSTTAVNLALALHAEGARAAILDADIYGPSEPLMLGATKARPETLPGDCLQPIVRYGIQSMSIGYLLEEGDTPVVWRAPMVTKAFQQLLHQTQWNDVDYLIVDLPPGTGDIQLTLAQQIPLSGVVVVTTPQDLALLDVTKCVNMFNKVNVPILGVVENMSVHVCSQCGHQDHIFGEGGAARISKEYNLSVIGSMPLDVRIREQTDKGKPSVAAEPDGAIALCYREIAHKMAAKLSLSAKDLSHKFPNIVIEER